MADGSPGGGPAGRRREHPLLRWLTTAWCLFAGALLAMAPRVLGPGLPPLDSPALDVVAGSRFVAWAVSAFGVLLLACGAWDVSRFVTEELR